MAPLRTIEARWFVRGPLPDAIRDWFDGLGEPVEAESRTDLYLAPSSDELGVKLRAGAIEPKRRTGAAGPLAAGRAEAEVSAWAKWSFPLAAGARPPSEGWVAVEKTRWQRYAEGGGGRCSLEIAEVTANGETWHSVALEASGPDEAARQSALGAAARWLGRAEAPALPSGAALSYPAWLRRAGG